MIREVGEFGGSAVGEFGSYSSCRGLVPRHPERPFTSSQPPLRVIASVTLRHFERSREICFEPDSSITTNSSIAPTSLPMPAVPIRVIRAYSRYSRFKAPAVLVRGLNLGHEFPGLKPACAGLGLPLSGCQGKIFPGITSKTPFWKDPPLHAYVIQEHGATGGFMAN